MFFNVEYKIEGFVAEISSPLIALVGFYVRVSKIDALFKTSNCVQPMIFLKEVNKLFIDIYITRLQNFCLI